MRKVAVFVEGMTEQVFVRELLLKWFDYQNIKVDCVKLLSKKFHDSPYSFGSKEAENHFLIVWVGNDNAVLSCMKERQENLKNAGYDQIIGLQDMFGEAYQKLNNKNRTIDKVVIEKIVNARRAEIEKQKYAIRIDCHFAIMEIEAWLLGLKCLEALDDSLTPVFIQGHIERDLIAEDPEDTYYHPAAILTEILGLVNKPYRKHGSEVEAIISVITKEMYVDFYQNGCFCRSLSEFMQCLLCPSEFSDSKNNNASYHTPLKNKIIIV